MSPPSVYISGIGIISALGSGLAETEQALRANQPALSPLTLFPLMQKRQPLPVGQVRMVLDDYEDLPRTHRLAAIAAEQAMAGHRITPDAVILGTTTGGILTTEHLLRKKELNKSLYRFHGLTTVAEEIARICRCTGPALTVSTACSSGAVAITLALRLLRTGQMQHILVGGADSLCRLTYFGFHSLQLVDRDGCRPLDKTRQGMSVAEGAALLLLTTRRPQEPIAEIIGAGLSCDAYHPAAPHPEGRGAYASMAAALDDAGIEPEDIGYLNFHGTGTPDNDLAESKAVHELFPSPPPLSSIKGATGHSLAASGAIEAAVAALCVSRGLIPANTGCLEPDPALGLKPVAVPLSAPLTTVLSNSFGFGGNNGSLLIARPAAIATSTQQKELKNLLAIHGTSCLTGAGDLRATMNRLREGNTVSGIAESGVFSQSLPAKLVRRLKRLPRMALFLALAADESAGLPDKPGSIFLGSGWGALSETYDFLTRLTESEEQFPSPTDFVGSVHNAPASQAAIMCGATGANVTASGGDYSFEQALLAADLMINDSSQPALVLGVDEGHPHLSPLLDSSIEPGCALADGGGALVISTLRQGARFSAKVPLYLSSRADDVLSSLIAWCGGSQRIAEQCGLVLAGLPHSSRLQAETQLQEFLIRTHTSLPVIRYRRFTGEFASASAVAAVAAVQFLEHGLIPGPLLAQDKDSLLGDKCVLVLGFGKNITAMEFARL